VKTLNKMKSPVTSAIVYKASGQFHCSVCDRAFNQRSNALTHYKSIHINVRKQCPYCDISVKKLKNHIRNVHSFKNVVQCEICGKSYKEGRLLKDHLNKVHCLDNEGNSLTKYSEKISCRLCDQEVSKIRLARHLKEKHYLASTQYECPLCASQVKFLSWHLRNYHKFDKKLYKCHRCEKVFINKVNLDEHIASHEEYSCQDCGENFEKFLDFSAHLDITHDKFSESSDPQVDQSLITKYYIDKEIQKDIDQEEEEDPLSMEAEELHEMSQETITISVDDSGNIIKEELEVATEATKVEVRKVVIPKIEVKEVDGVKLFDIIIPTSDPSEVQIDVARLAPVLSQRLTERFRKSSLVPRDLRDVKLPAEDEELLQRCPEPEKLHSADLARYQIQSKAVSRTKYESCPSRQAHLCPYCRKVLRTRQSLSSHIAVVHRKLKTITCHLCGSSCATKSELAKHHRAVHDERKDELVECGECGEKVRKCYLNRHMSYRHCKNNLPKICHKCGKDFKSRETMLKHVRKIHS